MAFKWKHTVYNLLKLTSFMHIMPLRFTQVVVGMNSVFLLIAELDLLCGCAAVYLSINQLKNILVILVLGYL